MSIKLKKKQRLFFRIALAALLVWIVVMLLDHTIETVKAGVDVDELQAQIDAQQRINDQLAIENAKIVADVDELQAQIDAQQHVNDQLATENTNNAVQNNSLNTNDSEFYLEQYARDRGYSYSGEIIFVETPGN